MNQQQYLDILGYNSLGKTRHVGWRESMQVSVRRRRHRIDALVKRSRYKHVNFEHVIAKSKIMIFSPAYLQFTCNVR